MKEGKAWYKSTSNWLVVIACIVLIPILITNVFIIFKAKANADEVPSVFGLKPFIVLSGSMENEIFKGDLIITKVVDPETLVVDDIIAFRDAENTVTTHRIIDIVDQDGVKYFITKGDNNRTQDQNLVELKDVEGIYLMRIPGVGNMMNALAEPTTLIIIILGITIIFGIGFAISNRKASLAEKKEFLEYKRMVEEMKQAKENSEKNDAVKEVKKVSKEGKTPTKTNRNKKS